MKRVRQRRHVTRFLTGLGLLTAMIAAPTGTAHEAPGGPVAAEVLRVLDGDSVEVSVQLWRGPPQVTRVRLAGIVAPELRGACDLERRRALAARDFLTGRLPKGATIRLSDIITSNPGRLVLARVGGADGEDLSETLLHGGFAHAAGGSRATAWCD